MNLLARLKKENSNYYVFMLMIVIPIWVNSVNAFINFLLPKRNFSDIIIIAMIPIIFLLADDGKLDEFYKYEDKNKSNKLLVMSGYDTSSK